MIKELFKTTKAKHKTKDKRHKTQDTRLRSVVFGLWSLVFFVFISSSSAAEKDVNDSSAGKEAAVVQNLTMKGKESVTFSYDPNGQIIVFEKGFSMTVGPTDFSSDKAVIWLVQTPGDSAEDVIYRMTCYLKGKVRLKRESKIVSEDPEMAVLFLVDGEVSIKADKKRTSDPRGTEFYADAYKLMQSAGIGLIGEETKPVVLGKKTNIFSVIRESELSKSSQDEKSAFRYPINLAPQGKEGIKAEIENNIATLTGGFYLSQKRDVEGKLLLLEMQADNAVIYLPDDINEPNESKGELNDILSAGVIKAIYLSGNVVMTEGQRIIRADEIFYDYENQRAIVLNAVMRSFSASNGIPIYVRASKLQQLAANKFAAENAVVTTSEFYIPQLSLNAASIIITDNTAIERQDDEKSKNDLDISMKDVNLKYYNTKLPLFFPKMITNLELPDIPLKYFNAGNDEILGTYVETGWYTSRLLGLREPENTDSTLFLDYYGNRGPGGGIETTYNREDYFGRFLGYVINDHGQDDLGRASDRKNLEPDDKLRGRLFWQNRYFLPYKWQLTTEISYISDENFLESFYRKEYYLDKPQETLVHMKRIEDNWGLSLLGKIQINEFENVLEESPTAEFHWTGQSFWDDNFTFYSDTQVSRLRQRYADESTVVGPRDFFSFISTRNEIDMPLSVSSFKIVPFVAGTAVYEDGSGFYTQIDNTAKYREDDILMGEFGVRGSMRPFWKIFPDANSQLWDLNQLRHVIQPRFMAVSFAENHSVAEQHDVANVGITQRLQTKRGFGTRERTVDWMRLNTDVTWVNDPWHDSTGADRYLWNNPIIPFINEESAFIPQWDRRGSAAYGPRHSYLSADYTWNLSDSTVFLTDMHYDLTDGSLQQYNFGISHMRQPNLSYYVGCRYLKNIDNGYGEHGTDAFTYAVTYILDPRYSLVYAGQFDFDYGKGVRNDIALIRRYHRLCWSVSYNRDESLDRQSIEFSLWPQGVPYAVFGSGRYMDLGGSAGF